MPQANAQTAAIAASAIPHADSNIRQTAPRPQSAATPRICTAQWMQLLSPIGRRVTKRGACETDAR
jgi:hypothetical protein